MAKTSVYLPDDLAEQARAHGIPISEVAQAAIRRAVREAQLKEEVMTDIQAVAERLREEQRHAAERERAADQQVYANGAEWARTTANAEALRHVAEWDGSSSEEFQSMASMTYGPGYPGSPKGERWKHFQAGAREVWEAVQPLLMEIGERGQTLPAGSGGYSETVNPEYRLWLSREPAAEAPLGQHDQWAAEEPAEFL